MTDASGGLRIESFLTLLNGSYLLHKFDWTQAALRVLAANAEGSAIDPIDNRRLRNFADDYDAPIDEIAKRLVQDELTKRKNRMRRRARET
jgi:hypothetical protein